MEAIRGLRILNDDGTYWEKPTPRQDCTFTPKNRRACVRKLKQLGFIFMHREGSNVWHHSQYIEDVADPFNTSSFDCYAVNVYGTYVEVLFDASTYRSYEWGEEVKLNY